MRMFCQLENWHRLNPVAVCSRVLINIVGRQCLRASKGFYFLLSSTCIEYPFKDPFWF